MAIGKGVHKYSVTVHRKEYEVSVNQNSRRSGVPLAGTETN